MQPFLSNFQLTSYLKDVWYAQPERKLPDFSRSFLVACIKNGRSLETVSHTLCMQKRLSIQTNIAITSIVISILALAVTLLPSPFSSATPHPISDTRTATEVVTSTLQAANPVYADLADLQMGYTPPSLRSNLITLADVCGVGARTLAHITGSPVPLVGLVSVLHKIGAGAFALLTNHSSKNVEAETSALGQLQTIQLSPFEQAV